MKITFLPQNIVCDAAEGENILQAAVRAGVSIDGNCAGKGTCGKCRVKILEGDLSVCEDHHHRLTDAEAEAGYRLACCHPVSENMVVEIPEAETTASRKEKMVTLPEGFVCVPQVKKYCINVPEATIDNQQSDETRITQTLGYGKLHFSLEALRNLPAAMEEGAPVTVTLRGDRVIDVEKGDTSSENYGVAVDIGTTTVVVMLWNIAAGEMVDVEASTNPQGAYGADVISRITFSLEKEGNLDILHSAIIDCINKAVRSFTETCSISEDNIYQYTVVGNTTMSHIFCGVNPAQMSHAPFAPAYTSPVVTDAEKLGLAGSREAEVYVASNIAGHVGSDITAGVITTDLMDCDKGHLFIDIGTNGEIVLTGKGRALACSTAAGPAFEGSSIRQGMRAAAGAIEKVNISDGDVSISVIGDAVPMGICGSGIIDAIGEMIRAGIIDKTGRILSREKLEAKGISEGLLERIRENGKVNDFVLYFSEDGKGDVVIGQKDVREVQLAKAAISAGITIMMEEIGITTDELEEVSIAGAFGSYIRSSSAIELGLLPEVPLEKIHSLGNSAGIGASMILLSEDAKTESEQAAGKIEHVELAAKSSFQDQYMMAMMF